MADVGVGDGLAGHRAVHHRRGDAHEPADVLDDEPLQLKELRLVRVNLDLLVLPRPAHDHEVAVLGGTLERRLGTLRLCVGRVRPDQLQERRRDTATGQEPGPELLRCDRRIKSTGGELAGRQTERGTGLHHRTGHMPHQPNREQVMILTGHRDRRNTILEPAVRDHRRVDRLNERGVPTLVEPGDHPPGVPVVVHRRDQLVNPDVTFDHRRRFSDQRRQRVDLAAGVAVLADHVNRQVGNRPGEDPLARPERRRAEGLRRPDRR